MTATKSKYWGIVQDRKVLMTGTFQECWDELVSCCGPLKLSTVIEMGIRISRIK